MENSSSPIEHGKAPRALAEELRRLTSRPGFQFLDQEDFLYQVLDRIRRHSIDIHSPLNYHNLCLAVYSDAVYWACLGENDDLKSKAFVELGRYLYRIAYSSYYGKGYPAESVGEEAREATQQTLLVIFEKIHQVNEPDLFLKWCIVVLQRSINKKVQKAHQHPQTSLTEEYESSESSPKLILPDPEAEMHFAVLENEHIIECLLQALKRIKNQRYRDVLVASFFVELSDRDARDLEIARNLGVTKGNLYTIRSRALEQLRHDERLRLCLEGLSSPEL